MAWDVEYTDEFERWWAALDAAVQESVAASVGLIEALGPHVPFPHSSGLESSRHGRMRELRVQHKGAPYRILYAFDPRRTAILLVGGDKAGEDRFYERMIPMADRLYDEHLETLRAEGLIDDQEVQPVTSEDEPGKPGASCCSNRRDARQHGFGRAA